MRHRMVPVPETQLYEIVSIDEVCRRAVTLTAPRRFVCLTFDLAVITGSSPTTAKARPPAASDSRIAPGSTGTEEPPGITANLAGPLVIDIKKGTARQLVIEDPDFPLQVPVVEEG